MKDIYINREISWLAFNHRVLQEAADTEVPLFERIKFLAIFSSNLDEFYRVRVASLMSLLELNKKSVEKLKFNPSKLIKQINFTVNKHQEEFGNIFRKSIVPSLRNNNIYLVNDTELNDEQSGVISKIFREEIKPLINIVKIKKSMSIPFLKNGQIYFSVKAVNNSGMLDYFIVNIPSDEYKRFIRLPDTGSKTYVIYIDDIIRHFISELFPEYQVAEIASVKLTRGAHLNIDDEFSGNLLQKIKKGLNKRPNGPPCRFLYDKNISFEMLDYLQESLSLFEEDLVPGGRYHNFSDYFGFPRTNDASLSYKEMPPMRYKELPEGIAVFDAINAKDNIINFPYHTYDHVLDFLNAAATDKQVESIKITQYRVARDSEVVKALIRAVHAGKDVTVFVEIKARFDEESNIYWAEEMEKAGIKVHYSFPGLKVHAKIALIHRKDGTAIKRYAFLSTGNFNEKNAKIYTDIGYFTSHEGICSELDRVFEILEGKRLNYKFTHLLVAQFNMRKVFIARIRKEIENARQGKKSGIIIKVNGLEDRKMIKQLYEASNAGVSIKIICRGICCLKPGVAGLSENIEVISIVDRFLEHSRVFVFHNNGNTKIYAGSADWMKRNLSRRIEVVFPIYDDNIQQELMDIINIQLSDRKKARIIEPDLKNLFKERDAAVSSSQELIYNYFESGK